MIERLSAGQRFPGVNLAMSDGSHLSLPDDMGEGWKAIIFFRGIW